MVVIAAMRFLGSIFVDLGRFAWLIVVAYLPWLLELLWLLSTGQIVRFAVRIARMIAAL
jgi:hypothetical protein